MSEISDRIRGSLLGLACGDALGSPVEFCSRTEVVARYGGPKHFAEGGGMAGASYDGERIPSCWLSRLMHRERLENAAQGLDRVRTTLLRFPMPERTP